MPTPHVFCNCKLRLLIDLLHSHSSLLRLATPTPACRRSAAVSTTLYAAAAAVVSPTVTPACSSLAPTSTTAAIAPRWLATALAEVPYFMWSLHTIPTYSRGLFHHMIWPYQMALATPNLNTYRTTSVDTSTTMLLRTYSMLAATSAIHPHIGSPLQWTADLD